MPDVESSRLARARPLFAMMMPARVTFESSRPGSLSQERVSYCDGLAEGWGDARNGPVHRLSRRRAGQRGFERSAFGGEPEILWSV